MLDCMAEICYNLYAMLNQVEYVLSPYTYGSKVNTV